jgi:PhoH-like ATPase
MKKIVLDTSALMENNNIIERLINFYDIIISIVTLEELDKLKRSDTELKSIKAQVAIRQISLFSDCIKFDTSRRGHPDFCEVKNDDIILGCAFTNKAEIYTHDIAMKIKAKIIGVNCVDLVDQESIYKGYVEYFFNTDQYNEFWEQREKYYSQYYINQYIIIYSTDTEKTSEYRFNGEELVKLKLPNSRVLKGENAPQRCALDMLNNKDISICALLGTVGSGKTFLSLRMALNNIKKGDQTKILGVREPVGEGKQIGYLPGDFEDKTYKFFMPLIQSLDGGEQEFQGMIDNGEFESTIPLFLKGTTFNNTIIVSDEAEDLTEKQIRLIGTRLGENSRIFFAGDYKQSVNNDTILNPLIKTCEELKGNPNFACIYLQEDVRSEASKIFATLFTKK